MKATDIDRILASEEHISPSPDFLGAVMKAVEREAAFEKKLQFPWLRALPGLVAMVVALIAALGHGFGALRDPSTLTTIGDQLGQLSILATEIGLQWIALALAMTMISIAFSTSLMTGAMSGTR
ncbi:MAG: hypothetical protein AB7E72_06800 [Lysobacterales bacterium]